MFSNVHLLNGGAVAAVKGDFSCLSGIASPSGVADESNSAKSSRLKRMHACDLHAYGCLH